MRASKEAKENPNKLKPEEYNEKQMLDTARAFFKAAKMCNEPSYKEMGWVHPLLIPIVVNISLACELFMKTLMKINDGTLIGEHNLLKLFNALPEKVRSDVIGSDDCDTFTFCLKQNACLFEE
ncbi:MAG: hypothetical protein ACK5H4_12855 [Lacrimispora sphenoides]